MKLLAIHDGHNSSVALMEDGRIVFAVQEERLTREKNTGGFPKNALQETLEKTGNSINEIDKFIFVGYSSAIEMVNRQAVLDKYRDFFDYATNNEKRMSLKSKIKKIVKEVLPEDFVEKVKYKEIQAKRKKPLKELGVNDSKVIFLEHHLCHAASAAYGWRLDEEFVVITLDSSGDGISGTVNLFEGSKLKRLAEIKMEDSPVIFLIIQAIVNIPSMHCWLWGSAQLNLNQRFPCAQTDLLSYMIFNAFLYIADKRFYYF